MKRTAGAISAENIRAERGRLKITADDLAERCEDPGLTAPVIRNIESGRRRTPVSVEEWLGLAYALGVPPETLLLPESDTAEVEISPGVTASRDAFLRWVRGQTPLAGTDERHYRQIAAISLPTETNRAADARDELLRRVGTMLELVDETAEEIARATRGQVYQLLGELQQLLQDGTPRAQVIEKVEGYKDRLADLI